MKAWTVLLLTLGALVGYVQSPLVWPIGPVCFVGYVLGGAYNRSDGFEPGRAGGFLRWDPTTWERVAGGAEQSAFLEGLYAARFAQSAMATDWRWWSLVVPAYGFAAFCYLLERGAAQSVAASLWTGDSRYPGAWRLTSESGAWMPWVVIRVLLLPVTIAGAVGLWRVRGKL